MGEMLERAVEKLFKARYAAFERFVFRVQSGGKSRRQDFLRRMGEDAGNGGMKRYVFLFKQIVVNIVPEFIHMASFAQFAQRCGKIGKTAPHGRHLQNIVLPYRFERDGGETGAGQDLAQICY